MATKEEKYIIKKGMVKLLTDYTMELNIATFPNIIKLHSEKFDMTYYIFGNNTKLVSYSWSLLLILDKILDEEGYIGASLMNKYDDTIKEVIHEWFAIK